ncbi:RteC domain-containing protein [Ferruginibacter sp.]
MQFNAMQLYAQMQEDIGNFKLCCKNELLVIEGCFNIASQYWTRIKHIATTHFFISEAESILFFKHIKPSFVAVLKFYTLHYQALLFKPGDSNIELVIYWLNQLKRIEKFYERHRDFYDYYVNGQTDKDLQYFTQDACTRNLLDELPCDSKAGISPSCIAARILGYREYHKLVEAELRNLLHGKKDEPPVKKIVPVCHVYGMVESR